MRPWSFLVLLATLAGCAAPAADVSPPTSSAPMDVDLAPASGSFLLATSAPTDAPCKDVGTAFGPEPPPGTWVAWALPEGALRVRGQLTEDAAPNMEISWRVCAFADGTLLGEASGLAPLTFDLLPEGATSIDVFVGPEGGTTLANAGAQVGWALSGTAEVSAPADAA